MANGALEATRLHQEAALPYELAWGSPSLTDIAAFEELYRSHGGRMKSVAMNLLGNTSDAEDAVQEAFLKLYRSWGSFKGESLRSTWLYRILVNTCYDMGRRRKRTPEPAAPEEEEAAVQVEAPRSDHTLRLTIERALLRLPEVQRSVFLLFEVEGFKHREIAEILDIAEGTSKHALFTAKRELQERLLATRRRRAEA
jgi:RNA polymerase sigma-70 factor (ECF subfamily)